MKKALIIALIATLGTSVSLSQTSKPDARLSVKYSKEELNDLKNDSPEEIRYLNFCIENAFYLAPVPTEKGKDASIRGTVKVADLNNINFFELGLDIVQDNYQYYRIEGSDQLLVVRSKDHIIQKMTTK